MKPRGFYSWHLGRILLGGLFVYAGIIKGLHVEVFAEQVAAYEILSGHWNLVVAAILPFIELIVGLHLVFNRWVRASAVVVAGFCSLYLLLLASVVLRGLEFSCGCFGPEDTSTPLQAFVRLMFLLAMSHFIFHLKNHYTSASTDVERED